MNNLSIIIETLGGARDKMQLLITGTSASVQNIVEAIQNAVVPQLDLVRAIGGALLSFNETFWVRVDDSSFVENIGYNFVTRKMTVELSSGTYPYENVDPETFLTFANARSKGTFFNQHLRNR